MSDSFPGEPELDSPQGLNAPNPFELEALFKASLEGSSDKERVLGDALLACAYNNDLTTAEKLINSYKGPIDYADAANGLTALHIAVGRDHLRFAIYLVGQGAAFSPDNQGRTPTTIAAECEVSDEMCDFIADAEAHT